MTVALSAQANALIELQHIQLELENGRDQHLRHFVDQYYCYKQGFTKRKSGRADWESIVWKGLVSREARQLTDRRQVVKEHVVPLKVITRKLVELAASGAPTCKSISGLLDQYLRFATISKREDRRLRKAGLTSKMPVGFDIEGHPLHNDILCRYAAVGIMLK
jgi:hypothetical protein